MLLAALWLSLTVGFVEPAFAGPPKDEEAARGEYIRLTGELRSLAERNAWPGVESTYRAIVATGIPPSYEDHIAGAHAARALGDVTSARDRLLLAHGMKEEKEAMDWLWEIDSAFGKVALFCVPGAMTLEPAAMPFQPDRAAAVRYAQDKITTTGAFEGYLPEGTYTFGTYEVKVQPRVSTVRIDARAAVAAAPAPKAKPEKPERGRKPKPEPEPEPEPVVAMVEPEPVAVAPETVAVAPEPPAPVAEAPKPAPVAAAPKPVVEAPKPAPVAEAPKPAPVVEAPKPAPVAEAPKPSPVTVAPDPEPDAVAMVDPEPAVQPDPVVPKPVKPEPQPRPDRRGPEVAVLVGTGNRFGTIAGAGLAAVVRPVSALGIEVGGGYDVAWTRPGFSAGLRAYPVRIAYLGAAYAPVVWYRGDAVDGPHVAYGPTVVGGLDLGLADLGVGGAAGHLKFDVSGGVGFTKLGDPVPEDQQQRVGGTIGLGVGFAFGG